MIRLIFLLSLVFGLFVVSEYFKDEAGFVTLQTFGYEIEMSMLFLFNMLVLLGVVVFYWGQIWFFIIHIPSRLKNKSNAKRLNEGMTTLFKAYEALGAGDGLMAEKLGRKSEKLLAHHPLTELVLAESSHLNGDEDMAKLQFKKLSEHEKTPFIGLRGLLAQAYRLGKYKEALDLAQKAYSLKPKSIWVKQMLFEVLMHNGLFLQAYKMLPAVKAARIYEADELCVFEASLCLEIASEKRQENIKEAQKWAEKGLKVVKNFVPLVLFEGELYQQSGQVDKAEKRLASFWRENPNNTVLEAWKRLARLDVRGKTYLKKAEELTKSMVNEAHGAFAMATIYMEEKEFEKARPLLVECLRIQKNKEAYALLAEVDDELKGVGTGYKWLKKALDQDTIGELSHGFVSAYQKWQHTYKEADIAQGPANSTTNAGSKALVKAS